MNYDDRDPGREWEVNSENSRNRKGAFFGGLAIGIILCLLVTGLIYYGDILERLLPGGKERSAQESDSVINDQSEQKIKALEALVEEYYYLDEVSAQQMEEGLYRGLISALDDPYSEYYDAEEYESMIRKTTGVSYGIGAYIGLDKEMGMPQISSVMEGTPAKEAGLLAGDIIYKVNDEYTQGMSVSEVVSRVKGEENTKVHLTIYREGESDYLEFDIVRQKMIELETVVYEMLENDIGYVAIGEFDDVTLDQYKEAMAVLRETGMKGLILDLRSNPGGNLITVTEIAREILPAGLIVYTEDKSGQRSEYTCDGSKELDVPLVVLINEYSASASEILAGAIKDYNKGTLVGTTTYGKGIVQRILTMSDKTAVKLTVSAYFTPSGANIHGVGVEPDIELKFDSKAYTDNGYDNQLEKAIEILQGKLN